ncbi:odorant binding [Branchiostoma belcheri]|nr:odorant binding [Branchiostoma belcheri]
MNTTDVFTEATYDATTWFEFYGTSASPVPTSASGVLAACTLTAPTRCGIYGAAPSLQPLLIVIWLGFLLWSLFGNGWLGSGAVLDSLYRIHNRANPVLWTWRGFGNSKIGPFIKGLVESRTERGNYFLSGIAMADILLAVVHAPASISSLVSGELMAEGWCRLQAVLSPGLFNLSMSFMTGLWYCRYRYIVHPLTYQATVTSRRIAVAMATSVAISFLPPAIFVLRHHRDVTAVVGLAYPPVLTIPCNVGGPERLINLVIDIVLFGVCTLCIVSVLMEARKHRVDIANQAKTRSPFSALGSSAESGFSTEKAGISTGNRVLMNFLFWKCCVYPLNKTCKSVVKKAVDATSNVCQFSNLHVSTSVKVPAIAWAEQANAWRVQIKLVYTHLMTLGVNCLTWLPILVIGSTLILNDSVSIWLEVFWMVNQTSTFSDSVVFAFRYEIYRKALKQMVRKIRQIIDEYQYDD